MTYFVPVDEVWFLLEPILSDVDPNYRQRASALQ